MSQPRLFQQKFLDYKTSSGFWLYLMTDMLLFASLFATYAVLHAGTAGGVTSRELFDIPLALTETLILLTSSLTCGLAMLSLKQNNIKHLVSWLGVTYVLGVAFLTIELSEFFKMAQDGHSWQSSAFLSAFFTLVGTHGLHIFIGLLWLLVMVVVLFKRGITHQVKRQLGLFGIFWHFLDLVWIFIFTVVYLMGGA